ncbi:MAG TPA: hypothetical protein DEA08_17525 [Planctomycetes bacterium]|nr:hypothetical protein [Planctomycetota bacterium]
MQELEPGERLLWEGRLRLALLGPGDLVFLAQLGLVVFVAATLFGPRGAIGFRSQAQILLFTLAILAAIGLYLAALKRSVTLVVTDRRLRRRNGVFRSRGEDWGRPEPGAERVKLRQDGDVDVEGLERPLRLSGVDQADVDALRHALSPEALTPPG